MLKHSLFQSLLLVSSVAMLLSCQKEVQPTETEANANEAALRSGAKAQPDKKGFYYGPAVALGSGTARTFLSMNPSGKPKELGIEISQVALQTLPPATSTQHEYSYVLQLPSEAMGIMPYKHVYLNWNPEGHEPPEIYGAPHFDFHFYTISSEQRDAIPAYVPNGPFDVFPSLSYLPEGYQHTPGGVPQMGKHWIDPNSPEFHGQPFTYTFIYGTYNGNVIFSEPMITLSTLQSRANHSLAIPQPQQYPSSNTYYPRDYNIYFDQSTQNHYVTYSNFKKQ